MTDLPPFPVDDSTLGLLRDAARPPVDALRSGVYGLLSLLSEMSGDPEGPQYHLNDAVVALVDELRSTRALLGKVRDHVGQHGDGEVDVWSLRELLAGREPRS